MPRSDSQTEKDAILDLQMFTEITHASTFSLQQSGTVWDENFHSHAHWKGVGALVNLLFVQFEDWSVEKNNDINQTDQRSFLLLY